MITRQNSFQYGRHPFHIMSTRKYPLQKPTIRQRISRGILIFSQSEKEQKNSHNEYHIYAKDKRRACY